MSLYRVKTPDEVVHYLMPDFIKLTASMCYNITENPDEYRGVLVDGKPYNIDTKNPIPDLETVECTAYENWTDEMKSEYDEYILNQSKEWHLKEISKATGEAINKGIDVALDESGELDHFSLSIEDQTNINDMFNAVILGATHYIYHVDNEDCKVYTAEQITKIYIAKQTAITQIVTYGNMLRKWIRRAESMEELEGIQYGVELPADIKAEMDALLKTATEQMNAVLAKLSGK